MDWYYTLHTMLILLSAAIQIVLGLYVWQHRNIPAARSYFWLKPLTAGWLICLALEISSQDLESKLFWNMLRFAFIGSAPFLSLIFVLDYTGHHAWLSPRRLVPLALVPAAGVLLNLTNPLHGLVWQDYQVFRVGSYLLMDRGSEPWFLLFVLYSYGLTITSLSLLLRAVIISRPPYRMQALIILIAFGNIPLAHILYILQIIPGLSLMPIMNVLGGLLIVWALFRYKLFDIVPVAHHLLVEQMREGLIVLDARWRVVDLNPAAQALFGNPATFIGRPVTEAIPILAPALDIPDASTTHRGIECYLPAGSTAADQDKWVEVTLSQVVGRRQQERGWMVVLRNRTEQRQMRQQMEESEAKYRSVVERANDGIAIVQDECLHYCNPQLAHLLGTTVAAMENQPVAQFFAPAAWPTAQDNHARRMRNEPAPARYETLLQHRDGHTIPVEINASVIDYIGRPATLAFIRDMTERKQAEDAVRKLSRAVEQSPAAIVITDTTGAIEYVNPWFTQLTGYTLEEALGKNPRILKSGKTSPNVYADLWQTIIAGKEWAGEIQNVKKNGDYFWEHATIGPVLNETGAITHYVAVKYDITSRKRLEAELRQSRDAAEALNRLGNVLQRCTSLQEAYGVSVPFLSDLFSTQSGGLYLYPDGEPTTDSAVTPVLVGQWGNNGRSLPTQYQADCPALADRQMCLLEEAELTRHCPMCGSRSFASVLCVPLQTGGAQLGVLYLRGDIQGSDDDCDRWSRMAMMAADLLALAFANLRLREHLREQAIRDPLTGLFNRHVLAEMGEQKLNEAARHQRTLGVFLFDIDHFKRINDTYGHDAGDVVLRTVSNFLGTHLRAGDIACRFGGEEFLMILPEIGLDDAVNRANALREGIQHLPIIWHQEPLPPVTVSIGIAGFPDHATDLAGLIAAADAALYQAKRAGRNLVCVTEQQA